MRINKKTQIHVFFIMEFSNNINRRLCDTPNEVTPAIRMSNSEEIKVNN